MLRRRRSLVRHLVSQFRPLTTDDVISTIRRLPDKTSAADLIPTSVLKQIADLVAPFVTELFNLLLNSWLRLKAFIAPIVKKPGLDATNASSYRPISNLSSCQFCQSFWGALSFSN